MNRIPPNVKWEWGYVSPWDRTRRATCMPPLWMRIAFALRYVITGVDPE